MFKILILIFSIQMLHAQDEIETQNFEVLDALGEKIKQPHTPIVPAKPRHTRYKEEWEPSPFKAILKKNTIIKEVETEKYFTLPRDMYVHALAKERAGRETYILTADGEKKYLAETRYVISVQEDLELYPPKPPIDPLIVYKEKTQKSSEDKKLSLQAEVSMLNESITSDYFDSYLNDSITNINGSSFDFKLSVKGQLPVNFGLMINIASANGELESTGEKFQWRNVSIGPILKYPFKKTENFEFSALALAMRSISFSAEKEDFESVDFSSTTFGLGIEGYYFTRFGDFGVGLNYRVSGLSSEKIETTNETYPANKQTNKSMSFGINYRYGFNL